MRNGRLHALSVIAAVLAGTILVSGCTTTQQGTAAGVGIGAAVGAIAGNNMGGSGDRDKGALIGGAVGGLVGHQLGQQKETRQQQEQRLQQLESQAQSRTVWITNANGSRTSVVLRAGEGGTWVGPKGEVYSSFPTEEQLRPVYGID